MTARDQHDNKILLKCHGKKNSDWIVWYWRHDTKKDVGRDSDLWLPCYGGQNQKYTHALRNYLEKDRIPSQKIRVSDPKEKNYAEFSKMTECSPQKNRHDVTSDRKIGAY